MIHSIGVQQAGGYFFDTSLATPAPCKVCGHHQPTIKQYCADCIHFTYAYEGPARINANLTRSKIFIDASGATLHTTLQPNSFAPSNRLRVLPANDHVKTFNDWIANPRQGVIYEFTGRVPDFTSLILSTDRTVVINKDGGSIAFRADTYTKLEAAIRAGNKDMDIVRKSIAKYLKTKTKLDIAPFNKDDGPDASIYVNYLQRIGETL